MGDVLIADVVVHAADKLFAVEGIGVEKTMSIKQTARSDRD